MDVTQEDSGKAQRLAEQVANRAVGEHLQRRIREGDPETGWLGDPFLVLTYDPDDYWRIWDTVNGRPDLVAQKKADGSELNAKALTAGLAKADLRRQSVGEILDRTVKHNEYINEQADKAQRDKIAEQADRVAFELRKDIG